MTINGPPAAFILGNTTLMAPPLVPEIRLHLASELYPLWRMTDDQLAAEGVKPPYWAFAWAGGQALARYIIDNPETVAGRYVLDAGSGSGLVALAAARSGARVVVASDIDPLAGEAILLNAAVNDANIGLIGDDIIGESDHEPDTLLIGDLFYEQPLASRVEAWGRRLAAAGTLVLIGDPGRSYFPKSGVELLATYEVKTTRELEDNELRRTRVYRLLPE